MQQQHYFLTYDKLQALINQLIEVGYTCYGPQLKEDAITYAQLTDIQQLPWGMQDKQAPGEYTLTKTEKKQAFLWASAVSSIKPFLFSAEETVWKVVRDGNYLLQFHPVIAA